MSEQPCTAIENNPDDPPNILMVPQCTCPKCKPDPIVDGSTGGQWLRASGTQQRLPVEAVTLSDAGKALLG